MASAARTGSSRTSAPRKSARISESDPLLMPANTLFSACVPESEKISLQLYAEKKGCRYFLHPFLVSRQQNKSSLLTVDHVSAVPTALNLVFAFEPTVPTAAIHTTTINASITAYSTAVGPSSETRNRVTLFANLDIALPFKLRPHAGNESRRFLPARFGSLPTESSLAAAPRHSLWPERLISTTNLTRSRIHCSGRSVVRSPGKSCSSNKSLCQRRADGSELGLCIGANGTDSGDTDNDDQCQHNCIFNCSWAVF